MKKRSRRSRKVAKKSFNRVVAVLCTAAVLAFSAGFAIAMVPSSVSAHEGQGFNHHDNGHGHGGEGHGDHQHGNEGDSEDEGGSSNTPPTIDPIADITVSSSDTVSLTAHGSDSDGDALTYSLVDFVPFG